MIRTRRPWSRLAAAALAVLMAGACASKQKTPDEQTAGGGERSPAAGKAPEEQFTGRSVRLFEDAVAAFEEQKKVRVFDWALLEQKFKAVISADDRFGEAYYNLGVIYERQRKPEEAKKAYEQALKRKPSLKQAAENLAVMLQNEGRPADAVALYQNILRQYPEDGAARARLAALYREAGDLPKAMELAREALMREPQSLTAYKVMMRCYLERNELSMAKLIALRATEQLKASDPELSYTVGTIHEREGDEQGAVAYYRKAIDEREDFLAARVRIAEIASSHQDWSTAAEQYRKIAQYSPRDLGARINLGIAYRGLGQIDNAMAEYDAVLKQSPDAPLAHYAIGVIFQLHKDAPEKAIEHYKKFIAASREPVPADHPVFENIRECEQYIRQIADMKAAEERAKKEAEEQKRLEEQKKREEEEKARAEQKAKEEAERQRREQEAKAVVDAALGGGQPVPAKDANGNSTSQAATPPPAPVPAPEQKAAPAKEPEKKAAPATEPPPGPTSAEPASDEPQDNL